MTADGIHPAPYSPSPAAPDRRGFWRQRWRRVLAIFMFVYVSSYLALSYRGRQEAVLFGIDGFFYLPPQESRAWEIGNRTLMIVYYPLNFVDRHVFGGMSGSAAVPMWRMGEQQP